MLEHGCQRAHPKKRKISKLKGKINSPNSSRADTHSGSMVPGTSSDHRANTRSSQNSASSRQLERPADAKPSAQVTGSSAAASSGAVADARPSTGDQVKSKIPPVVLRSKQNWPAMCREIDRLRFAFSKAQNTTDEIRIHPATITDYRGITRLFNSAAMSTTRTSCRRRSFSGLY